MKASKFFSLTLAGVLLCGCFSSCSKEEKTNPDFSGYQRIVELATLECEFHNVAEIYNDGTDLLLGLNFTYKKAWFEYDGEICLGIDVSKVIIEGPDDSGVVRVHMPKAQVVGYSDADESTFSDVYSDTGLMAKIEAVDQTEAYKVAQENMKLSAESNEELLSRARSRAELLLERFIMSACEAVGQNCKVEFVDV